MFEGSSLSSRDRITGWWADRQNAAFLRAVQLTEGKLRGVTMDSVTAPMLKLNKPSPDGEHFPTEPWDYKAEALCQATELHCGRLAPVDASWMRRLADVYRPDFHVRPDVHTAIREAHTARCGGTLNPRAPASPRSPSTFQEMYFEIKRSGSKAAAFGKLVQSVLHALSGTAIYVLTGLLHAVHLGDPVRILNGVLHLCLLKKDPPWLARRSRPVMLEEPFPRKESTAIFHRLQAISTAKDLDPPSSFAYNKEFTGQRVGLFCRWAIPEWLTQRGRLWVVDWEESNAFCNVQRGGQQEMCPDAIAVDPWYHSFDDRLAVYVHTPLGLVGPYRMLHGGAQGDGMGVGGFRELGSIRSRANATMVSRALRPESGLPGGLDPEEWCPTHPAEPNKYVPEVSSSDDRRFFAYSDEGICHALRVNQRTCLAGGGAVNRAKMQAFCLTPREGAIPYNRGTIETALSALQACTSDLAMVRMPVVMGESPRAVLVKYKDALRHLGWALPRTVPFYALVVARFAPAKADFMFDAVPLLGIDLTDVQKLSDVIHLRALGLPRSFPRAVRYRPLERLGLALPRLPQRHAVRYVHAIVSAIN